MNPGASQHAIRGVLRDIIEEEIRARGPIPFSRYMELCLYHPELGYYSRPQEKFGKAGDFYTSSDVHAVFGRLLSRQFDEMWRALGSPARVEIIELGAGRGLFAQDVLAWSEQKFPEFFAALHYQLVESSPSLRQRLHGTLAGPIAKGQASVYGDLDEIGERPGNAIVFANEFFDARPVEVITAEGELRIGSNAGRFVEWFAPASAEALEFLERYGVHPEADQRVEVAPVYIPWIRNLGEVFSRGFVVVIDYGYTRGELLAGRHRGTVRSFRRHAISDTPYDAPGEQDITADVNFTALADLGAQAGLDPQPLVTQSQFLLGIGEADEFADAFQECRLPQEQAKVALQLKHLVTPAGMGESFQVLVLSKGIEKEKAARLSGLSFGKMRGEDI
jgi:SAM-dependent MidA family methyltransferase